MPITEMFLELFGVMETKTLSSRRQFGTANRSGADPPRSRRRCRACTPNCSSARLEKSDDVRTRRVLGRTTALAHAGLLFRFVQQIDDIDVVLLLDHHQRGKAAIVARQNVGAR